MSVALSPYPDPRAAAEACAGHILKRLEETLAGGGAATLAVSGGSTPKLLFQYLAASRCDWESVHLFWVDERCVPPTHAESNYLLAEEHFLRPARFPHRNVHRIQGELPPGQAAAAYERELRDFFGLHDQQLPAFDVIHLGLGSDAHTASLFPGEPLIENTTGIVAAVYVEKLGKWRITLLPGAILAAREIVFLTAGEDKREALRTVLEAPYAPLDYPAQVIARHSRHSCWFLDRAAASAATA